MLDVLNLGGGVQSTTVLEMSISGDLPKLDAAIFADTGWEPKAVYEHVALLIERARLCGIPVHTVSAGDLRADAMVSQVRGKAADGQRWASMPLYTKRIWNTCDEDRQILEAAIAEFEDQVVETVAVDDFLWIPEDEDESWRRMQATKLRHILQRLKTGLPLVQMGMIRRQCTTEYKIEPIESFIKTQLLGLEKGARWPREMVVRQWFGISADESRRCRAAQVKWKTHWYPLVDMHITRIGCLRWLEDRGLPPPPRSACLGCPFHSDAEWRDMKVNRPDEFEDACVFDDAIRKCGGMRGDVFLHRSCQPLRDVDLANDVDRGQLLMFGEKIETIGCESGHCFM